MFNTRHMEPRPRTGVYCDTATHRSNDSTKVIDTSERRRLLAKQRLCFNCASEGHPAADCPKCGARHHISLCDKDNKARGENRISGDKGTTKRSSSIMATNNQGEGIFPK